VIRRANVRQRQPYPEDGERRGTPRAKAAPRDCLRPGTPGQMDQGQGYDREFWARRVGPEVSHDATVGGLTTSLGATSLSARSLTATWRKRGLSLRGILSRRDAFGTVERTTPWRRLRYRGGAQSSPGGRAKPRQVTSNGKIRYRETRRIADGSKNEGAFFSGGIAWPASGPSRWIPASSSAPKSTLNAER
jgi:hypothetical protein